jgi:hypothetical protein
MGPGGAAAAEGRPRPLRNIVISVQNVLLSDAIMKYLRERAELRPERVRPDRVSETVDICCGVGAEVLLMEVTRMPPFTLEKRLELTAELRETLPGCKVALLCDENAEPELAEQVKEARKLGRIDGFFYASVSAPYLSAALDAL